MSRSSFSVHLNPSPKTLGRKFPVFLLLLLGFVSLIPLQESKAQDGEYIVMSGGPALRKWEDLRRVNLRHDRWWGNFVRPAKHRMLRVRQLYPHLQVTWLIYKPAYLTRGREEGKPFFDWADDMRNVIPGIKIVWFSTQSELINYLNRGMPRNRVKILGLEFYGHSNRHCLMFDYSNAVYGASKVYLHEKDFDKINRSAFHKEAFVKSWGCHTGESMSAVWKRKIGIPMIGAVGKTDYSRPEQPFLSPGGRWVE